MGKFTFGRINYDIRTSCEKNTSLFGIQWYIWEGCGPQGGGDRGGGGCR